MLFSDRRNPILQIIRHLRVRFCLLKSFDRQVVLKCARVAVRDAEPSLTHDSSIDRVLCHLAECDECLLVFIAEEPDTSDPQECALGELIILRGVVDLLVFSERLTQIIEVVVEICNVETDLLAGLAYQSSRAT